MKSKWKVVALSIAAGLLILTGCVQNPDSNASADSASESIADASAKLSCAHFRNTAVDFTNGLLTTEEWREKLKQIYSDARGSQNEGIAINAQLMLSGETSEDRDAEGVAIKAFTAACVAIGH